MLFISTVFALPIVRVNLPADAHTVSMFKGLFNSRETAWLVCWETGFAVEAPAGSFIFLPSALITHWNVNAQGD